MTTIKELNLKYDDSILHPVFSYGWKLQFSGSKRIVQPTNILTKQTVYCKLDMLNKKAQIKIEQSILGEEYYQIQNLHEDQFTLRIDTIKCFDNNEINYAIMLHGCKLTKHEHDFNYTNSNVLFHDLELLYKDYEILIPATESTLISPGISVTVTD